MNIQERLLKARSDVAQKKIAEDHTQTNEILEAIVCKIQEAAARGVDYVIVDAPHVGGPFIRGELETHCVIKWYRPDDEDCMKWRIELKYREDVDS